MNLSPAPLQYLRDIWQGILEELKREDLRNVKRDQAETFNGALTVSGTLTPSGLLDLSGSGAGQIKFPASQNASSDANTLDDYEEGTFNPVFTAATPPTSVTYGTQHGSYRKIGSVVFVKIRIVLTSKGSGGVGAVQLTGLPFTSAAVPCALSMSDWDNINLSTGYTHAGASVGASGTAVNINENGDNVAGQAVTWANCANNSAFVISGFYFV